MTDEGLNYLKRMAEDMKIVRQQMTDVVNAIREAESEVPEKMRRFIMYMHDVHDIVNLYHEGGQTAPRHVLAEMERCDDRYRQLLEEMHLDGGTFEKVRREMAKDPLNPWHHTHQHPQPHDKPT